MVEIRRKLHEYPELLYEEFQTSELIQARLRDLGIRHVTGVAGTGVVGYIGTGDKPYVALRADMDALPIQVTISADLSFFIIIFFIFMNATSDEFGCKINCYT